MIYAFLANGFEETEAIAPIDILRRCGKELLTVGVGGKTVVSSHNIKIECDITESEIKLDDDLELIILPGGLKGTEILENSKTVSEAIDFCVLSNRYIAAICAAPTILGKRGLLDGKNAICYRGMEDGLKGAVLSPDTVVADGYFITGKGAGVSVEFGLKIAEVLISPEKAAEIADKIMCEKK